MHSSPLDRMALLQQMVVQEGWPFDKAVQVVQRRAQLKTLSACSQPMESEDDGDVENLEGILLANAPPLGDETVSVFTGLCICINAIMHQ